MVLDWVIRLGHRCKSISTIDFASVLVVKVEEGVTEGVDELDGAACLDLDLEYSALGGVVDLNLEFSGRACKNDERSVCVDVTLGLTCCQPDYIRPIPQLTSFAPLRCAALSVTSLEAKTTVGLLTSRRSLG